jgi:mannose-6-phosphate isomerase
VRAVVPLENRIQEYDWGSRTALAELLGLPVPSARPQAELWIGAHPVAPSRVRRGEDAQLLSDWLAADPRARLGGRALAHFGAELPFLLKVIAAAKPLSIQAHPDGETARRGFEREQAAGLALDARRRNYRDARHKPELVCALTRFVGLCGFRAPAEIRERIAALAVPQLALIAARLAGDDERSALRRAFESLLRMPASARTPIVAAAALAAARERDTDPAYAWIARLAELHPRDAGVLAPLFLNLVVLEPGEALYLGAGVLHAYLEGTAVELMANSDNVLRGGLTAKHVDVDELLAILRFEAAAPARIPGQVVAPGVTAYPTPTPEFALARLEVERRLALPRGENPGIELLLCVEGALELHTGDGDVLALPRGASCAIAAEAGVVALCGRGIAYRASVGVCAS